MLWFCEHILHDSTLTWCSCRKQTGSLRQQQHLCMNHTQHKHHFLVVNIVNVFFNFNTSQFLFSTWTTKMLQISIYKWFRQLLLHFQSWSFDVAPCFPTALFMSALTLGISREYFWFESFYKCHVQMKITFLWVLGWCHFKLKKMFDCNCPLNSKYFP